MEAIRTIVCKLVPTPEQVVEIDATLLAFAAACNRIAEVCRETDSTSKFEIQKACYHAIRGEFKLSANLAIRAIARVCTALKVQEKDNYVFTPTSIDYDARIFSFCEKDWSFSLTLLNGRERIVTCLGEFQRSALQGQQPTSAQLVKHADGNYYLHVQIKTIAHEPIVATDFLGVDLGIAQIAVDSDGNAYSGKPVEDIRRKHNLQRKRLQRRNTKGAKKKLKRIAGKEARFRRHENHCISKKIVQSAKRTARGIALEDLTGIRERIRARGGDAKNRLSGWAFYQLRTFVGYKALRDRVSVKAVDPRNTSRTCNACGYCAEANRKTQANFVCQNCGHSCNADWNAALNIRSKALAERNTAIELAERKL